MTQPLFDFVAQRARLTPRRLAFEQLDNGRCVTFAQLHDRVAEAAGLLHAMAPDPGARVAILCRNRIEFFELLFACGRSGKVAVPLNWRMPAAELGGLISDCTPALLVSGREDDAVAQALASEFSLPTLALDDDGQDGYVARLAKATPDWRCAPWPPGQLWYLLYTSGTTGQPKAVMQTFGMALANMVNISQGMGLRGDDVTCSFLPLFHTGGINLLAVPFVLNGATTLVMPGFDPELLVTLLRDRRLTVFFGVPAVYQALALHPEFDALDLAAVRSWACGGAPLPDALVRRYAQAGALVCNGMGMTETGPTAFLMDCDHVIDKIGSVGKAQILTSVRLVDSGRDVAAGEVGEIWFSGPGITPGYYQRPEATSAALTEDGWLRSQDLGRVDEDGYYYVVGRLKDMFISGGENVYPAEVENVLAAHPAVLEAAVIRRDDPKWGEVGVAFVQTRPGAEWPGRQALVDWCRKHLAAFKVPADWVQVTDFPRTAAGKVQKHLLLAGEND